MSVLDIRRLEVPLGEERLVDILQPDAWQAVRRGFEGLYSVSTLYEGPLGGHGAAQITRLLAGNPDAEVRVVIDASPAVMSRVVLGAGRAMARTFATRTNDRARMLHEMSLLIHLAEPADSPSVRPLPPLRNLEEAVGMIHSPALPAAWSRLSSSVEDFRPTMALDLRDSGGAAPGADLLLIQQGRAWHTNAMPRAGQEPEYRAGLLARELTERGLRLRRLSTREQQLTRLMQSGDGVAVSSGPYTPPLTQGAAMASQSAAFGLTGLGLGTVEGDRAEALTTFAAAAIMQALRGFRLVER